MLFHDDNICDNRNLPSSKICDLRDGGFCGHRNNAVMDSREILRTWLDGQIEKKGHGARKKLAECLGVGSSAITRMTSTDPGKESREITAAELLKMAEFFGEFPPLLSPPGDHTGELKRVPLGQEFDPDPEFDDGSRTSIVSDDLSKLGVSTLRPFSGEVPGSSPDIDTSAGAGPGGLPMPSVLPTGEVVYSADAVRGEILMPDYLLSEFTRAKAPRVHWIKVRGDSMEPTLLPGERVMVDTTDQHFGQGGVFVIRDPDGEILVKRLRKLKDGEIELVSDNPKQPPMVHRADEIGILGRVVGRLARL
ncbi:MAG: S24 family peptidase [Candidatus Kaistia colombiensis]|nr:MAG: S24 family peptidase [Kaistia sp.]